ncbi:U-box domain-containing protein 16 [Punica granatum]|uniref:U-box domain-containing protein 16 n=2 Tax=Punica granatum TaxID=22663 RepID=A0A6P8DPA2_PUNGR|nr:U-box domain-containing protein 16 [Punica granatum]PKI38013.1 hypothetical protein CRG98_041609 [Punica granatum]
MAVTPHAFPPRKRRPSAGAFISPKFSDTELVQSLLLLSQEISNIKPFKYFLRWSSLSMIRKVRLLAVLFEELLRSGHRAFSASAVLCFEEMYILLQRIKTSIEDCSNGSKMWLLMQAETASHDFRELTSELSTVLDVFPLAELGLGEDIVELVGLIRRQCSSKSPVGPLVDSSDKKLRLDVVAILDRIKAEIIPDQWKLAEVFERLGLRDSSSCREEMESLEEEVQNQVDERSKSEVVALIGLVRYAKCVLYGGSTPSSEFRRRKSASGLAVPVDFRCPITLDLMQDPVVVATGQTYDRDSISLWIQSGHNTCPKTGQALAHKDLIPNRALKNLIAMWCKEKRIPFETTPPGEGSRSHSMVTNKAALEATKMTASYLINKLAGSTSTEAANGAIYELRVLAKTDSDSRTCIAEAGALPLLVRYLGSDVGLANPSLQVNAVTTILNLSILEANKARIMDTEGVLNGVIEVLRSGATWEAKGNAAATIFSLSGAHSYVKRLGRKIRVIKGLTDLARDGPNNTKRDALAAILNLASDRETVGKLIEGGVVEMVCQLLNSLQEEAVTVLEAVVRRGGIMAAAAAYPAVRKLGALLREGSDRTRESAASTLVMICRKGGSEAAAELATVPGIERLIWELMGTGTARAKRKAASLLRILRRWAAGLDSVDVSEPYTTTTLMSNVSSSTRIMLPS